MSRALVVGIAALCACGAPTTEETGPTSSTGGYGGSEGGHGPVVADFEPGEERPGGDTTVELRDEDAFLQAAANLSAARRGPYEAGFALFDIAWLAEGNEDRDGLGPTYLGTSCRACHFRGGRGTPPPPDQPMTSALVRLSLPDGGGSVPDDRYGEQLQTKAIAGVSPEGWVSVAFEAETHNFDDGAPYELLSPRYSPRDLAFGSFAPETLFSIRVAPPMIGLGLLEAIDEADIRALADPGDLDGDGISGRTNEVPSEAGLALGRFGLKANQPDLRRQTAAAFLEDLGITSPVFPDDNCPSVQVACQASAGELDIDEARLDATVFFSSLLAVPHRPEAREREVLQGKALFISARCDGCHHPSFVTGELEGFPELSHQRIFPYSDLLLHDLGEGLADGRPDFEATGREWRTPPLWGVGLTEQVSGHTRLLHDGRARSVEEAILWHGGEGEAARDAFVAMSASERAWLVRFVRSL